jgi:hypothetical protein
MLTISCKQNSCVRMPKCGTAKNILCWDLHSHRYIDTVWYRTVLVYWLLDPSIEIYLNPCLYCFVVILMCIDRKFMYLYEKKTLTLD